MNINELKKEVLQFMSAEQVSEFGDKRKKSTWEAAHRHIIKAGVKTEPKTATVPVPEPVQPVVKPGNILFHPGRQPGKYRRGFASIAIGCLVLAVPLALEIATGFLFTPSHTSGAQAEPPLSTPHSSPYCGH